MKKNSIWIILIAYGAFIALGLYDGLLGVAWPSLRESFGLPLDALGILLVAAMTGHVVASFSNGRFINRAGVAVLLVVSSGLLLTGQLLQTTAVAWWVIVAAGVVGGLGGGMMDAGMNTYAARHFRPRLLNWLHASFGLGTTLGSLLMTAVLSAGFDWRMGIGILAAANGFMLMLFLTTRQWWRLEDEDEDEAVSDDVAAVPASNTAVANGNGALRLPVVWLSILIFFLYTGIEIGIGHWNFSLQTESRGLAATTAGLWTTIYWGSFTVGRVVLGFIELRLAPLVRWALVGLIVGTFLLTINGVPWLSLVGLFLTGFALAPIFPALVSLTPRRVGKQYASHAIGYQIGAAGLGGAALPGLAGVLADSTSLEIVPRFLLLAALLLFALHELILWQQRQTAASVSQSTSV